MHRTVLHFKYEKANRYFQTVAFRNQRCERRQPTDYKNDAGSD